MSFVMCSCSSSEEESDKDCPSLEENSWKGLGASWLQYCIHTYIHVHVPVFYNCLNLRSRISEICIYST